MSKLVLYLPDGTTLDIPLDRERMTIGRRADNEICLPNLAVSGEHAVVVTILADSFLEDLGSTNGTLVNGKAIAKHFLRDRDEIDIGKHKLVYCSDDDAVLEPAVTRGMARVRERDSGGRVEMAKLPERGQKGAGSVSDVAMPRPDDNIRAVASRDVEAESAREPVVPATPLQPAASIKVLTGVNAGVSMSLTKTQTTIGRPGVQVAAIVKSGEAFVLRQVEGERAAVVNNRPVAAEGTELFHGDVIELAGKRLEFISAGAARPIDDLPASSASEETKA